MELLDVADEYGNLTGEVMDREKVHDLNLLHWEVAVFIINNKKQILLQKRAATKRFNPNKWGLCAWHVNSGESIDDVALREVEEELGLKLSIGDLHVLEKLEVNKRKTNSHLTRIYYAVCNDEKFKVQTEELSEVKWFHIDDVIDMVKNNDDTLTLKSDRLYLLEKLKHLEI